MEVNPIYAVACVRESVDTGLWCVVVVNAKTISRKTRLIFSTLLWNNRNRSWKRCMPWCVYESGNNGLDCVAVVNKNATLKNRDLKPIYAMRLVVRESGHDRLGCAGPGRTGWFYSLQWEMIAMEVQCVQDLITKEAGTDICNALTTRIW